MNDIFLPIQFIIKAAKSGLSSELGSYAIKLKNDMVSSPTRPRSGPGPSAALPWIMMLLPIFIPQSAHATQMHSASEGILVHQLGHLFFLISMGILIFTIQGKKLHREKGWRLIQYSALFFILWNMDAIGVHLLDNQTSFISTILLSMSHIQIEAINNNEGMARLYYLLRLDHLLCLPAMMLLYRGLSLLVKRKHLP